MTFPSGANGRQQAAESSLLHDDPAAHAAAYYLVHDLLRNYTSLHMRIWKAARIVASGRAFAAHPLRSNMHVTAHMTASDGGFYPVSQFADGSGYTCDCADIIFNRAPRIKNQMLCKHILALKIYRLIERPLPPFLASPHELHPWMDQTGAEFNVIGAYNRDVYTAYAEPIRRTAVPGEVVVIDDRFYRLIGSSPKIQTYDVTDELASATDPRYPVRLSDSYAAHTAAVCAAHPPQNTNDNEELTAALISMTAAAKKNYPSKRTYAAEF